MPWYESLQELPPFNHTFIDESRDLKGFWPRFFNTLLWHFAKFLKNIQVHQNDNKRIMKENVDLINTINELKREKKVKTDNASIIIELKMQTKKEIDLCLKI